MVPQNRPITNFLQNIFLVFSWTKTFKQVWNYLRVSKWWQNFHFWEKYNVQILLEPLYTTKVSTVILSIRVWPLLLCPQNSHLEFIHFVQLTWQWSDAWPASSSMCVQQQQKKNERSEESECESVRPEAACHKVRLAVIICWSMCVCVCVRALLCVTVVCGERWVWPLLAHPDKVKSPFTLHQKSCQ